MAGPRRSGQWGTCSKQGGGGSGVPSSAGREGAWTQPAEEGRGRSPHIKKLEHTATGTRQRQGHQQEEGGANQVRKKGARKGCAGTTRGAGARDDSSCRCCGFSSGATCGGRFAAEDGEGGAEMGPSDGSRVTCGTAHSWPVAAHSCGRWAPRAGVGAAAGLRRSPPCAARGPSLQTLARTSPAAGR